MTLEEVPNALRCSAVQAPFAVDESYGVFVFRRQVGAIGIERVLARSERHLIVGSVTRVQDLQVGVELRRIPERGAGMKPFQSLGRTPLLPHPEEFRPRHL